MRVTISGPHVSFGERRVVDLAELAIAAQWYQDEDRKARREDRKADRSPAGQSELDAYNA